MTEYIYTADDYGPVEFINNGIIQGVKAGLVNSVQVLTNFDRGLLEMSLMELSKVVLDGKELELGVHLTMTSGKPLTLVEGVFSASEWHGFLDEKDNFYDLSYYSFKHKEFLRQLAGEFSAQRDRLLDAVESVNKRLGNEKLKVTVISNHHNLVSIDFELLKVYLNTATITDNNGKVIKRLACRTTNFKPTESSKLYFGLAIFLKPVFKKRQENLKSTNNKLRNKIIELNNGYLKYKVPGNKDVTFQTSLYSDMTFYRVLGSKSWWMRYAWLRYLGGFNNRQKKKLVKMYERAVGHKTGREVNNNAKRVFEFIFHLGDVSNNNYLTQKDLDQFYPGITVKYFDDRQLELQTLLTCTDIIRATSRSSWKDTPMVTFHATGINY